MPVASHIWHHSFSNLPALRVILEFLESTLAWGLCIRCPLCVECSLLLLPFTLLTLFILQVSAEASLPRRNFLQPLDYTSPRLTLLWPTVFSLWPLSHLIIDCVPYQVHSQGQGNWGSGWLNHLPKTTQPVKLQNQNWNTDFKSKACVLSTIHV